MLETNNRSEYLLQYLLILPLAESVTESPQEHQEEILELLKKTWLNIQKEYGISLDQMLFDHYEDAEADYLCVRFRATPSTELAKFINAYKSASSRWVKSIIVADKPADDRNERHRFWLKSYLLLTAESELKLHLKAYYEHLTSRKKTIGIN